MPSAPERRRRGLWRWGPAALALPGLILTPPESVAPWVTLLVAAGLAQAARIERPRAAWWASAAIAAGLTVLRPDVYLVTQFVPLFPFAQIASAGDRRRTLAYFAGSVALAATFVVTSATGLDVRLVGLGLSVVLLPVPMYAAVGAWSHGLATRRLYAEMLLERAERLEREQDQQAELAVLAERGRIARDLHDVVTHGVAVMVVQADAADRVWDADPARGRQAVRAVAETGRSVMGELRAMLDAMRGGAEDATVGAQRSATAGLERAEELVGRLRSAGVETELHQTGELARVPPATSLAAERILRESLTNVLRHAQASRTVVTLRVAEDAVHVRVADDGVGVDGAAAGTGGHGITGMRERASLAGGTLAVEGGADGGTTVTARLPLEPAA